MRKTDYRCKGFGLIGVFMIITVLAVICGGGAYVYQRDHKKPAPKIDTTASANVNQPPTTNTDATSSVQPAGSFFTCLAANGTISKQRPTSCSIDGKVYQFPTVFTTADIVNYSKLPVGLHMLVSAVAQKNFNACVQNPPSGLPPDVFPLTTIDMVGDRFVSVAVENCDSPYSEDFGLKGSAWVDLGGRQNNLSCSEVREYGIVQSSALTNSSAFTTCWNTDGTTQPIAR